MVEATDVHVNGSKLLFFFIGFLTGTHKSDIKS